MKRKGADYATSYMKTHYESFIIRTVEVSLSLRRGKNEPSGKAGATLHRQCIVQGPVAGLCRRHFNREQRLGQEHNFFCSVPSVNPRGRAFNATKTPNTCAKTVGRAEVRANEIWFVAPR